MFHNDICCKSFVGMVLGKGSEEMESLGLRLGL